MTNSKDEIHVNGNATTPNCSSDKVNWYSTRESSQVHPLYLIGRNTFAYLTPLILLVGILGNTLSLHVFLSKNMRRLSATSYLAAISCADLLTLIFYVSAEWLRRGLKFLHPEVDLTFLDSSMACQIQLYLSYVFRFLSAWLVVAFTVERYIGICHPLLRRDICSRSGSRKIIIGTITLSLFIVMYKPFLSGAYQSQSNNIYCTSDPNSDLLSFVLDSAFAVLITLLPFVIITVLNVSIMRKLFTRSKRQKRCRIVTEESIIRLEFTIILLVLSFCFIAFNIPYFALWLRTFLHSKYVHSSVEEELNTTIEYWQGVLYITRTIFYINYCINFFLYSITGAYFRRELRMLFFYRGRHNLSSFNDNSSRTPQSLV